MKKLLIAAMLSLSLAACGGGSDGPTEAGKAQVAAQMQIEQDYYAIIQKIRDSGIDGKTAAYMRPDVVTDEDLQKLLKYAYSRLQAEPQMSQALITTANGAIEYRKQLKVEVQQ